MAAEILRVSDRITVVPADTLDENDTLRLQNPLGKMPCLCLPDGGTIFDSRVILEFLQELANSDQLLPREGPERFRLLTQATLADGITDAALLMVYEGRFHPPEAISRKWLEHQGGKVSRALSSFERSPPDPAATNIVTVSLACALGYLDWRKPLGWRAEHPALAAWLARFAECEPSFNHTAATPVA